MFLSFTLAFFNLFFIHLTRHYFTDTPPSTTTPPPTIISRGPRSRKTLVYTVLCCCISDIRTVSPLKEMPLFRCTRNTTVILFSLYTKTHWEKSYRLMAKRSFNSMSLKILSALQNGQIGLYNLTLTKLFLVWTTSLKGPLLSMSLLKKLLRAGLRIHRLTSCFITTSTKWNLSELQNTSSPDSNIRLLWVIF